MGTCSHIGKCKNYNVTFLLQCCLSTSGKTPKFSVFNGVSTLKGEVPFEQWVSEAKGVMQSHTEATLREGIMHSIWGEAANLV